MVYNLLYQVTDRRCRPGTMTQLKAVKGRMFEIYRLAELVDVDDLIHSPADVKEEFARIMDGWRKIHIVLDTLTSESSQEAQEAALASISTLLASFTWVANKVSCNRRIRTLIEGIVCIARPDIAVSRLRRKP